MLTSDVEAVSAEMLETHRLLKRASSSGSPLDRVGRLVGHVGRRLARPPRVLLLGEFNSGKTTIANALIGERVLPDSLLSNTSVPILVRYGAKAALREARCDGGTYAISWEKMTTLDLAETRRLEVELPLDILKRFEVIDTPPMATGRAALDNRTRLAAATANIAVWCTPATQAWKASEARTWMSLPERLRTRAILAVTFRDAIATEADLQRLEDRMRCEASGKFSRVVLVAARRAYRSRINSDSRFDEVKWQASGGADLQGAIDTTLSVEMSHRVSMAQGVIERAMLHAGLSARC